MSENKQENSKNTQGTELSAWMAGGEQPELDEKEQHPLNKLRLQDALQIVRRTHLLIEEIPAQIDRSSVNAFLDQLARLSTNQLANFTNQLNTQQVGLIYAAFSEPLYKEEKQILRNMALYRASYYTFIIGFVIWQHAFPNSDMQLTLSLVYRYLQGRGEERPPFAQELLADKCSLELSDRIFVQQCVRLLEKELLIKQTCSNLTEFFRRYAIQSKGTFAATVLGYFFLMVDWTWYVKESRMLFLHLPLMVNEVAGEIVSRLINLDQSAAKSKNFLFRQLEQVLAQDDFNRRIKPLIQPAVWRQYQRWLVEDKISIHCLNNAVKRAFLFNYLDDVMDAADLNSEILALRFHDFLLIDDSKNTEQILYYDNTTVRNMLARDLPETYLATPPLGVRLASDALNNRNLKGIISLPLADGDLKVSQMLLDFALQRTAKKTQAGTKKVLQAWTETTTANNNRSGR